MSERPMLAFHIAVSIATLVLWFVQLRSGSRLLKHLESAGAAALGASGSGRASPSPDRCRLVPRLPSGQSRHVVLRLNGRRRAEMDPRELRLPRASRWA
jgi:hypothetical protein